MRRITAVSSGISFVLVVSAFILTELWVGARAFSAGLCLFAILVAFIQTLAGWLALRVGGMTAIKARLPAAFCVGFVCLSLPMLALSSLFAMSAFTAFMVCAGVVLLLSVGSGVRESFTDSIDYADILVTLVLAVAIVLLTRVPVASALTLDATGALPIWSDFFLHGVTISSFGSPFARGIDMELAGVGRVFYHYAPFLIPAAFQSVSGQTGLALSTSVLLPLGVVIAALGCYAFAVQIGGRSAGVLAIAVVAAVPVFRVPLQSGWLDFYWMLLTAPGVGYAIGVSMIVCAAGLLHVERGGTREFWFMSLLLLSIILIRVHFFMLLAPSIAMFVGLRHRWVYGRAMRLGLLGALLAIAICWLGSSEFRGWFVAHSDPIQYLDFALKYTRWYGRPLILPEHPAALMLALKATLVLVAVLGAYVLVYPALLRAVALRFGLERGDMLAPLVALTFVGLMLLAPSAGNGDFTEYKHRHFPLLYVIIAVYAVVYAYRLAVARTAESLERPRATGAVALAVLAAAVLGSWGGNPAKPDVEAMPWGSEFHNQPVASGLLGAARYMRAHARSGDVMAMGGDAVSGQSRMIVDVISLTDIPAFLARSELRMRGARCVRRTVEMRADVLKQIMLATDWPQARRMLQENAIRWFLAPSGGSQTWDLAREAAAYSSGDVFVYDAGPRAQNVQPPTETCR